MDGEQIEVVELFKYLGSLKSVDGNNCNNDVHQLPNWNDQENITRSGTDLMNTPTTETEVVVRSLVWTVCHPYIAEGTFANADEKRI